MDNRAEKDAADIKLTQGSRNGQQLAVPLRYSQCLNIESKLRRFLDLLCHYWNLPFRKPSQSVEELLQIGSNEVNTRQLIRAEINKMLVPVAHAVNHVGLISKVSVKTPRRWREDGLPEWRTRDLLGNCFDLEAESNPDVFLMTVDLLERAIGAYSTQAERAKRTRWYPTEWLAWLLRLPVVVLQSAGLAQGKDAGDKALKFLVWFGAVIWVALGTFKISDLLSSAWPMIKQWLISWRP